jgi:predicted phage-related endonuclease
MMNDRNDFLPEVRNSAWWSGDSRKAANGRALDAILTKQGKMEIPDLSQVEAVQMGHVMQPVILNLAQNALKMEIKDADYSLTHPKEAWFRSHFDGITADGQMLVEAKNYNASVRNKFDFEEGRIPSADYAQLVHEAAVHNINKICLAVLFGGQEFKYRVFEISEHEKEELIKQMAVFWGHVVSNTSPEAETIEQTKLLYPVNNEGVITATQQVEQKILLLKQYKDRIKEAEGQVEALEVAIRNYMSHHAEIRSVDGSTLVSWKASKPTKKFDAKLFQSSMPDLYEKFVMDAPGSRRFLIK